MAPSVVSFFSPVVGLILQFTDSYYIVFAIAASDYRPSLLSLLIIVLEKMLAI
jgi:hypothetical protein